MEKAHSTKPRLLHVDDEPALLATMDAYFRKEGYEIYTALSSEEGLEVLSRKSVDIVITGIIMPGMNGWELIEIIRSKYDAGIIIFTGFHQAGDREKARQLRAD